MFRACIGDHKNTNQVVFMCEVRVAPQIGKRCCGCMGTKAPATVRLFICIMTVIANQFDLLIKYYC